MNPVFLDIGYLVALEASDDQDHAAARRHWRAFSTHPLKGTNGTLLNPASTDYTQAKPRRPKAFNNQR